MGSDSDSFVYAAVCATKSFLKRLRLYDRIYDTINMDGQYEGFTVRRMNEIPNRMLTVNETSSVRRMNE